MAITFVEATSTVFESTDTAQGTLPASRQSGDVLVMAVTNNTDRSVLTHPSGWTFIREIIESTANFRTHLWWRAATGTGDAPVMQFSGTGKFVTQIAAYRGVDTTSPLVAENGIAEAGGTGTTVHTTPTLSNTDAGAWGVAHFSARNLTTATWAPGAGLTERTEATTSATASVTSAMGDTAAAVATGNQSFSATSGSGSAVATMWLGLLRPAATGVTVSAALSGSGTLTAGGSPATSQAAALSSSGSVTAGVKPAVAQPATLSGSGTLSAALGAGAPTVAAGLSGAGTLTAAGTPAVSTAAALSGSGSLSPQVGGGSAVQVWTGTAWSKRTPQKWTGTAWVDAPVTVTP